MTTRALNPAGDRSAARARAGNIGILVVGLILVFIAGFAPVEAVHNAVHDTRHALGMPCH
jgi:cobalt transporter subunit CbtB